jgi:hypothetical protein
MKSPISFSTRNPFEPLALRAAPRFFQDIPRPWGAAMSFPPDVTLEVPSNLRLFHFATPQKSPSRREIPRRIGEPTP